MFNNIGENKDDEGDENDKYDYNSDDDGDDLFIYRLDNNNLLTA